MKRSSGQAVGVGAFLVAIILAGVIAPMAFLRSEQVELGRQIDRVGQLVVVIESMREGLIRLELEARDFALTGDDGRLVGLRSAIRQVEAATEQLGEEVASEPLQQERVEALERLVARRVDRVSQLISSRQSGGMESTIDALDGVGTELSAEPVFRQVAEIEDRELGRVGILARSVAGRQTWSVAVQSVVLGGNLTALVLLAFAVAREMARRRGVERELRVSEQRFRESFDAAAFGMALVGRDGRFLEANRALCDIVGRDEPSLSGMPFRGITHPEDADADREQMTALAAGRIRSYCLEKRYFHADGQVIWVRLSGSAVRDESGEVLHFVALIEDITARKRAEEALAERDRRFRAIFDGTYQFVGLLAADGTVLEANQSVLGFGGVGRDEVLGQPIDAVLGPSIDEPTRDRLRSAVAEAASGAFVRFEIEVQGAGEDSATIDFSIKPVRDESGRVVLLIPEGRDITARKRTERDREQIIRELERSRAEAERHSAELARARDRALAAVRAKGVFLANISHEIRTPMTGIIASAELLSRTRLERSQLDQVSTIRSSGEALRTILDDILDLSKIEAGRMSLAPRPMDLRGLVEDVAALMAPTAHRKGIHLHGLVAAEVPARLVGDPIRLRQVLLNLVGNAVKFTDEGEVAVEVRPLGWAGDGVSLAIVVRDTGIGIAPEDCEAIFESFTQSPSAREQHRAGGTGLGLTISQHLVHLMGGRIELESRPGEGSTFRLILTLQRASAMDEEADPQGPPELAGMGVLVAAPPGLRGASVVEQLRSWGCRPEVFHSAEEARRRLEESRESDRPRLLVVDLGLADGLDAPIGPGPRLPRVVIRPVDAEVGGLEPCADPTVGEPVRRSALQEAILQALRPGEIAAASAPPGSSLPQFGLSVLLAEDYETNRELVGQMIRLLGCRVDTVADGAQAVDAVRMRRYDLILMDLELPVLDGLQATVEIRGQERQSGRRTPVFAFTAHALEEDRQRCLAMGMDGVLTKPLRLATLCGFLSDFREARRRPAELLTS